jgi:GT2 family glycosyltransferase
MKVSVIIPAYNCEKTIEATLQSVLDQTVPPDEILVVDDGSTDSTPAILDRYRSQATIYRQPNKGLARARNMLCERATGDMFAFLDSDDIWHRKYLEVMCKLRTEHPGAVALFSGQVTFGGNAGYHWDSDPTAGTFPVDLIPQLSFFSRYHKTPGYFLPSFCCVPRDVMRCLGNEPFEPTLRRAEDLYFVGRIALFGSILYAPIPLVAYRFSGSSLSAGRLPQAEAAVRAFELLENHYSKIADTTIRGVFQAAFASKKRAYAKVLLGGGQTAKARAVLRSSLSNSRRFQSVAKSLALLLFTYLPDRLQPAWPTGPREWKEPGPRSRQI